MKSIEVINEIRGWGEGPKTELIPKSFEGTFKCVVKYAAESKEKEDGKSVVSCAFVAYDGTDVKGRYWIDGLQIGEVKDGKFTYPESFIGEFKGGKLMQATAKE